MRKKNGKTTILLLTIILSSIIAGLYGIVHDQITFSISNQYFTKFQFNQFGIGQDVPPRLGVTYVGLGATWWTGLIAGLIIGVTAFSLFDKYSMKRAIRKALSFTLATAVLFACIGYVVGQIISGYPINIGGTFISRDLTDVTGFIIVGTIHDFSYAGGVIGLLASTIWLIAKRKKLQQAT